MPVDNVENYVNNSSPLLLRLRGQGLKILGTAGNSMWKNAMAFSRAFVRPGGKPTAMQYTLYYAE